MDDSISALRELYFDRRYGTVVERAHRLLRDSLRAEERAHVGRLLGRAEQSRGRHEAAIDALQQARVDAIAAGESVVRIDHHLGESYEALYRWSQAGSAFRRVLEQVPEHQSARQSLGEVYSETHQWKHAREQYARLLEADSTNGRWWARLAQCNLQLGQTEQALQQFARAHHLLPQSADLVLPLSRLYRARGHRASARSVIDTTLTHRTGDPRLWRRRADLAFEGNALDRARTAYHRAVATGDSSATVYRRIGLIHVRRDQYERAVGPLRQSFRRDSTHTRTTLYLGIAYLQLDSLEQASHYLQRTIDREVDGPILEAFVQQADTRDQQGDVAGAVRAFRTALRLRPERRELYFRLANLYDRHYEGKRTAARYYRRFLDLSDSSQTELRSYSRKRLDTLRPILHMQGQQSKPEDSTE